MLQGVRSHSASCPHRAVAISQNIQMSLKCSSMSPACLTHPGFPACRSCPNPPSAVRELQGARWVVDFPHLCPSAMPRLSSMNEDVFQLWGPPGSSQGSPPSWHGMSTGEPWLVHLHSPGGPVWKVVWADLQVQVLPELSCPCPALSPQQAAVLSVIAILQLGTLTTRQSLIAPVICLSQQAAHPKQGD